MAQVETDRPPGGRSPIATQITAGAVALCVALSVTVSPGAAESDATLAFPRHPAPSPTGEDLAFSWQGDIWIVDLDGGLARRITAHPGYDAHPIWSPDGTMLAFSSERSGNQDVFVVPVGGGETHQLTFYSGDDVACDFSPNGDLIYFTSARDLSEFRMPSLYQVPRLGGTPIRTLPSVTAHAAALDDGSFVFMHGTRSAPWWRRGYTGSGASSLLRGEANANSEGGVTPFFDSPARELQPSWSRELGVVFLSEASGTFNAHVSRGASSEPLTTYTDDGIRFPRVARYAPVVAFERGLSIYVVTPGSEPRAIDIRGSSDSAYDKVEQVSVTSIDEYAVSPDGKEIAVVHRGEIFVRRADEDSPELVRITHSTARDHDVSWSPDSKSLVFASDRSGEVDVYLAQAADDNVDRLIRSRSHDISRLTRSPAEERNPTFSPDGESIAFLRGLGELVVADADGGNAEVRARGHDIAEYAWSPDSRWLAFSRWDHDFNLDIHVVAANAEDEPYLRDAIDVEVDADRAVNVTRHPGAESSPTWSDDGRKLAFVGERSFFAQSDVWYTWLRRADEEKTVRELLDEELWRDDAKSKTNSDDEDDEDNEVDSDDDPPSRTEIDFDEIHRRHHRVTTLPGNETDVLLSSDGQWIAYVARGDEGRDIWRVRWDGEEKKRLTSGGADPSNLTWHAKSKTVYFLQKSKLKSVQIDSDKSKSFPVSGSMEVDRTAERLQVFDEAWRVLNDSFYDSEFHGADWEATRVQYRRLAAAAAHPYDFQDAARLMLGELNSSHQNFWGPSYDEKNVATGDLGIVPEPLARGGVRVAAVLPDSPAGRTSSRLEVGDEIHAIDGVEIGPNDNLYFFLQNRVDVPISLTVDGDRDILIRPYSRGRYRDSIWKRDSRARRAVVEDMSDERLGYINLRHMGTASVDQFEEELYAVAHGKDGLVIDVRDNSGGWVTDILLHSLLAGDHAVTVPRGGGIGYPSPRRLIYAWTKPIIVLCNQSTFSNGEIFAWSVQTLGRGKLVGAPTFGGVISTGSRRLLDGSRVRRPFRGWYVLRPDPTKNGSLDLDDVDMLINMERQGCVPDILVNMPPDARAKGRDPQLVRAVNELLSEISQ